MSDPTSNISIHIYKDKYGTPCIRFEYNNPDELFMDNNFSVLQARKIISDYAKRRDIPVDIKIDVLAALDTLSKGCLAEMKKTPQQARKEVEDAMEASFGISKILKEDTPNGN